MARKERPRLRNRWKRTIRLTSGSLMAGHSTPVECLFDSLTALRRAWIATSFFIRSVALAFRFGLTRQDGHGRPAASRVGVLASVTEAE